MILNTEQSFIAAPDKAVTLNLQTRVIYTKKILWLSLLGGRSFTTDYFDYAYTIMYLLFLYLDSSLCLQHSKQGRGDEELSAELSVTLRRCLLGGKSGTGINLSRIHNP